MNFDKKSVKTILFLIFSATVFFWIFDNLEKISGAFLTFIDIIAPFILGGAIAFVVNVPMRKIEGGLFNKNRKLQKLKRPVAYLLTLISIIIVLVLAMFVIIPEIVSTIETLTQQIPIAYNATKTYLDKLVISIPQIAEAIKGLNINIETLTDNLISILQNSASSLLNISFGVVGSLIGGTVSFIIGFIFSIYLLFQKEKLACQSKKVLYAILPSKAADKTVYILKMANETFSKFISGQGLEALIIGVLFFLVMTIFRFPYAVLISVLIAITSLVPIIGAFVGCIIGALLILIVNPLQALLFVVMFLIVQQIEGNLIYPHVVGGTIGLPSIWVLVAVTVGGGLFGVGGILVFIPLCSVLYALFGEMVIKKLKEKKISAEKWS